MATEMTSADDEGRTIAGSDCQHGFYYQTAVSILYYCLGRELRNFHFIPEAKDAGVFDDIVFSYEGEKSKDVEQKKYCLIQVKHSLPEKGKEISKITSKDLLAEKGNFAISKYFKCFIEELPKFVRGTSIEHLIVFTRKDFDMDELRHEGIAFYKVQETRLIPKNSYMLRLTTEISHKVIRNAKLKSDPETLALLDIFVRLLVFAVNQPDYKEIENTVKAEVGRVFNLNEPENGNMYDKMLGKMWNLQATKDHKEKTPTTIAAEFKNHVKEIFDKHFHGITLFTRNDKIKLEHSFTDIQQMITFLKGNDQLISHIFSHTPTLTCLKVAHELLDIHEDRDYPELYFAIVDLPTLQKNMKRVQNTFMSKKKFILVIKCDNQHELAKQLIIQLFEPENQNKKIVLVSSDKQCHVNNFIDTCRYEMIGNADEFLKTTVNLQGEEIVLKDLMDTVDFRNMKSNVALCDEMVESGKLCIGKKLDNFEAIDSYYIELFFKKNLNYDESLVRNIPETMLLVFSGFDKPELENLLQDQKLLVLQGDATELGNNKAFFLTNKRDMTSDFEAICLQFKSKDIHWLEKKGDRVSVKKSVTLTMDALIANSKKVNVLIGQPGSGKSVALTKIMNKIKALVKNRNNLNCQKRWMFKINLAAHSGALDELQNKVGQIDKDVIFDLLCQVEGMNKGWEKELLCHAMRKPDCCHIFFDGFDEICPKYEKCVLQILKICKGTEARIWVSSRSHFQTVLEKELDCCSYSPVEFSSEQQLSFFENYWRNALGRNLDANCINEMLRIFSRFQGFRIRFAEEFIGIPLHTLMIADISLGIYRCKSNYDEAATNEDHDKFKDLNTILSFYDTFVHFKFLFYCKEKANLGNGSSEIASIVGRSASMVHKNAAIRLLFPEVLQSLLIDFDGEFQAADEISRVGLLVKEKDEFNFIHRTFAEYFIAKRLSEIITDEKQFKEDGTKYATVLSFLKEQYFAKHNRMIRIFLDLAVAKEDIHKAIINDDNVKAIRLIKADEECVWKLDFLGRSAAHLSMLYSDLCDKYYLQYFEFINPYFVCDVLRQTLNTAPNKICQTDKLGFNVLCYAIAVAAQGITFHQNVIHLIGDMKKNIGKLEIWYEIVLNILQMDYHIKDGLEVASPYLIGYFRYVFDFEKFVADNNGLRKGKALMKMANSDFPYQIYFDKYINKILSTDQNFGELLADADKIDLSYLKNENFLRSEEFQNWFLRTKEKNNCKCLRDFFKFVGCPALFFHLYKPSRMFTEVFEDALAMVKETYADVDVCLFNSKCDNQVVHLEKLLLNNDTDQFEKLLGAFKNEAQKEALDKLHFAKVINEVANGGNEKHLKSLLLMPVYQSNIEKMTSGAEYRPFIECFKKLIEKGHLDISLINACISTEEKMRVKKILNHTLYYEQDAMNIGENYQNPAQLGKRQLQYDPLGNLNKFRMSPCSLTCKRLESQWLDCYPLEKRSEFQWSLWEHLYILVICEENQWTFPPDILSSLQPDYIAKMLKHKEDFQSARHIFQLATDEQKIQICRHNNWEFLLHAICNYFEEITNEKCAHGRYLRKIQDEIPLEETKFKDAFMGLLEEDLTTLSRFITFLSGQKQAEMFRIYCIPKIVANKNSFHTIKDIFVMATDEQKRESCRHNDWEFLLHAICNYFDEITDKACAHGRYLRKMRNEIPLEETKFKEAFAQMLKENVTTLAKFIRILSETKQVEMCRTYYIPKILVNKDSFHAVRDVFQLATDEQKREICRHNDWEFLLHAICNYFDEITNERCGKGNYLIKIQDDIPVEGKKFKDAFNHLIEENFISVAKFTEFLSEKKRFEMFQAYYIPNILTNNNSFHLVRYMFQMSSDDQKRTICRRNDWEFLLYAICNYFDDITDEKCQDGKYLRDLQSEMPLEEGRFLNAFIGALEGKYYTSVSKFMRILNHYNQSKLWSAVYEERVNILEKNILEQDGNVDVDFLMHVIKISRIMDKQSSKEYMFEYKKTAKITDNQRNWYKTFTFPTSALKRFSYEELESLLWWIKPEQYLEAMKKMDFVLRFREAISEKSFAKLNEINHEFSHRRKLMCVLRKNVDVSSCIAYLKHMVEKRCREGVIALLKHMDWKWFETKDEEFTFFLHRYEIDLGEFFHLSAEEENALLNLLDEYTDDRYPEIDIYQYIRTLFGSLKRSRRYDCKVEFKDKFLQDILCRTQKLVKPDF